MECKPFSKLLNLTTNIKIFTNKTLKYNRIYFKPNSNMDRIHNNINPNNMIQLNI